VAVPRATLVPKAIAAPSMAGVEADQTTAERDARVPLVLARRPPAPRRLAPRPLALPAHQAVPCPRTGHVVVPTVTLVPKEHAAPSTVGAEADQTTAARDVSRLLASVIKTLQGLLGIWEAVEVLNGYNKRGIISLPYLKFKYFNTRSQSNTF
jgi:hypothetical protein